MSQEFEIPSNLQFNPTGLKGDYQSKVCLTKESRALNDVVIIEIVEQDPNRLKQGDIHIPEAAAANAELFKGKVVSVGPDAAGEGISVDDTVLYDKWSAFYNPPDAVGTLVVTRAMNVICKLT